MATIINIGVKREHVESRARILTQAGHTVKNAFSMAELEQYLREGDAQVLVMGHNLPGPDKRRVLGYLKRAGTKYRIIEVYMLVPELLAADAHVCWDKCTDTLAEAVETVLGLGKHHSASSGKAS
jgi:CheY-like chemotaxis protein